MRRSILAAKSGRTAPGLRHPADHVQVLNRRSPEQEETRGNRDMNQRLLLTVVLPAISCGAMAQQVAPCLPADFRPGNRPPKTTANFVRSIPLSSCPSWICPGRVWRPRIKRNREGIETPRCGPCWRTTGSSPRWLRPAQQQPAAAHSRRPTRSSSTSFNGVLTSPPTTGQT